MSAKDNLSCIECNKCIDCNSSIESICFDCLQKENSKQIGMINDKKKERDIMEKALKNLIIDALKCQNDNNNNIQTVQNDKEMLIKEMITTKENNANRISNLYNEIEELNKNIDEITINTQLRQKIKQNDSSSKRLEIINQRINQLNSQSSSIDSLYRIVIEEKNIYLNECPFDLNNDNLDYTFNIGITNIIELTLIISNILNFHNDDDIYELLPSSTRSQILKKKIQKCYVLYMISNCKDNLSSFIEGFLLLICYLNDLMGYLSSKLSIKDVSLDVNKNSITDTKSIHDAIKNILFFLSNILHHPQLINYFT